MQDSRSGETGHLSRDSRIITATTFLSATWGAMPRHVVSTSGSSGITGSA